MNQEKHLPYWKHVNKKGKVVIVPQTGSRLSPIHYYRDLYIYHMNYYAIFKEYLQLLHKLYAKDFQIALKKLSVMKFPLAEIEEYFPIKFGLISTDK